ncbi:hypothetical protein B0O80DRAFT_493849 [Mortierella sp. GBAus27b]|nr:hypothetical protein BGX31_003600 [Mortierella sp. GBA43]KAI8361262.1 hypothetical protein B0O80DRAFT_493849 [Mortierella sp. GBAus27b]
MSDKKVTPHQLRKNLAYVQQGPDFMRMLTGQSSAAANNDPRNPYRKPIGIEAKFQSENPDKDDEDDDPAHDLLNEREEERPTVVVLKDKKHLDERQVRNILKNLPPGLSEAEIQKRLEEEGLTGTGDDEDDDDDDEDDDNQAPSVDANGKILFRRPKGSKLKSKTGPTSTPISASAKKKNFEETLLAEATAKANDLKRKAGSSSSSTTTTTTKDTKKDSSATDDAKKTKKKKTTTKATSLLSFDDEE